ncbi:Heat shock factor protein [Hypsizygus marmoreus]|uniref:Heat shock factor protein n=1 Tax=Hypsizygus marmoreus TaxID=39966 RepID=A0A369JI68_HYPMA|nr:Heat shock factor protein [Hypsizygus marmoreus]
MSHLDNSNYPITNDYTPRQQWPHQQLMPQQPDYPPFMASDQHHLGRGGSLSLNISSLTVTSPANPSPINPSPGASSALSPSTPISPSANPFNPHHIQPPFAFDTSPQHYEHEHYDNRRTPGPSRASSVTSSSSQLPRKRSFTSNPPSATLVEESMYDEARDAAMELASQPYDDIPAGYGGSPVDGSGSNSGGEDASTQSVGAGQMQGMGMGMGGSMNILGKPMATNNFVTKLYQMISDPKSAHYIAWTELGTSFVVSNVGEFSRSILGSHFKHNNFSSFVRQLNMYGFHKINRTPRAQRTSTDAQTWEFSHHKFLRGRPDLLDEIKRKALEPDPAVKHRVELPGEVAAQLGAMREENRRVWDQLTLERNKSEKLVGVVKRLWDIVGSRFPVPPFPQDLLDGDSPNIYVTSATSPNTNGTTSSRFPPPLNMNMSNQMHSPSDSPTTSEFHHHQQHPHHVQHHPHHMQQHQHQQQPQPLSRQHSYQHMSSYLRGADTSPPSPGGSVSMDVFDDERVGGGAGGAGSGNSNKRQRMSTDDHDGGSGISINISSSANHNHTGDMSSLSSPGTSTVSNSNTLGGPGTSKRLNRARSDSAPLGYGFGWGGAAPGVVGGGGRPRSGSGLAGRGVLNIGSMTRGVGGGGPGQGGAGSVGPPPLPPMVSMGSVPSNAPNR